MASTMTVVEKTKEKEDIAVMVEQPTKELHPLLHPLLYPRHPGLLVLRDQVVSRVQDHVIVLSTTLCYVCLRNICLYKFQV